MKKGSKVTLYKLTNQNNTTRGGMLWGENITHEIEEPGTTLGSKEVIHAYKSPALALFMNPVHANYEPPILWLAEGDIVVEDDFKVGVKKLTTIKKLNYYVTLNQKIAFGILSSLKVNNEEKYVNWANNWLKNIDRSKSAASYAAHTTIYVANTATAANAAAYAAAYAAYVAVNAADATGIAYGVANAAANAATAAKAAYVELINFLELAEKALKYE